MPLFLVIVAVVILSWGLTAWLLMTFRLAKGEPVLPQEPRRPVPWEWFDVVAIVAAFIGLLFALQIVAAQLWRIDPALKWPQLDAQAKLVMLSAGVLAQMSTVAFGIAILRTRAVATLEDLGLNFKPLVRDMLCGAAVFLAAAPMVFGLQAIITQLIPYKHQLLDAVHEKNAQPMWIVATLSAVFAAPIMEEFLFRVVLKR
jgi:membrane protease YdiL (CAAX protease family)